MTFEEEQRLYDKARTIADLKKANWETELKAAIRDKAVHPPKPLDTQGPPPSLPRLRVGDTTTEALVTLCANQPWGIIVTRDDLSGLLGGFDCYSGSGGADRALALQTYDGKISSRRSVSTTD